MKILGSKFFGHDSALFVIDFEAKNIFAMSTERVTRIKHDSMDISPILEKYKFDGVDYVCHGFSSDSLHFKRAEEIEKEKAFRTLFKPTYVKDLKVSNYKKISTTLLGLITNTKDTLYYLERKTKKELYPNQNFKTPKDKMNFYIKEVFQKNGMPIKEVAYYDHHLCHAIAAYYFSPFVKKENVLSLTIDGEGDGHFSKLFIFDADSDYKEIAQSKTIKVDASTKLTSIGNIYSNFTEALGLRPNSDEGKVEALAAFSTKNETLYTQLTECTTISDSGIHYDTKLVAKFYDIAYLQEQIKNIGEESFASTIQTYLEDTICDFLNQVSKKYDSQHLCLSGGVAANIIMSLNIYERTPFKSIYVLPFMGDEGISAGSAILKALELNQDISWLSKKVMPYFGNEHSKVDVEKAIKDFSTKIKYTYLGDEWYKDAAQILSQDKVVSVVHGKMEFGPRALGNRSILANPVNPDIREMINLKVKKRPKYQPFCPSILEEERERLFQSSFQHKHMAIAFRVKEEFNDKIPSAIHVDGTARPQFVEEDDNPTYYKLLKELKKLTGFGVLINTSFNLHGRTIVHTPHDAILDYLDCNIDILYLEGYKIQRN
ncbi:carbamoyltransferase C-terminal domain-containing protein [Sulfurimonas sp. HSL-1716]|uniref:carbamoyltransferase C-terminal domain-containing protein n=1 Tax=Hydrocurvibacter sulfurireducens TaxID=3131937 RepID=UPI0031F83C4F